MDKETSGTTNLKEASVYPQEKQIRNYQCNNYDKHSSLEYHTSIHCRTIYYEAHESILILMTRCRHIVLTVFVNIAHSLQNLDYKYKINTWREDKFERSVANGTETVFVTLRFCVVRKQLKATLKPNAAGVQLPPHYYRNG